MTKIGRTLDVIRQNIAGCGKNLLQRNFSQGDDGDKDDDAHSDGVGIASGQDNIGGHLVTEIVAKHQQAYHSHA